MEGLAVARLGPSIFEPAAPSNATVTRAQRLCDVARSAILREARGALQEHFEKKFVARVVASDACGARRRVDVHAHRLAAHPSVARAAGASAAAREWPSASVSDFPGIPL
jgi:hypothetical protein